MLPIVTYRYVPEAANSNQAPETRTIVRCWSPCGPCLTMGELVRSTARFYVFRRLHGDDQERRFSCDRAHIEPCQSCCDHPRTHYPRGYMD